MHELTAHGFATKRPSVGRFYVLALALVGHSAGAEPVDEKAGIRLVCTRGPGAAMAHARALRGAAGVMSANVLPNPTLRAEHQRALGGVDDQETIIGLSVPLGIGGRRFILQDAAAARREEAMFDADLGLFEAALAFREAYVAAVVDRARVEALSEEQAALDALTQTIHGLTKGGEMASYDALRQETHARSHRRLLSSIKARAAGSRVALEAWTGASVDLPAIALIDLAGSDEASAQSLARHPRLRQLEAESRASALEASAARRRWVPDLELFAGYREATVATQTARGISISLAVPLTFFDHGQGEAAIADADEGLARATAEGARRHNAALYAAAALRLGDLTASLDHAATADAATLRDKATVLYAAGEATITELLEAFRASEEARLGVIDTAEEIALLRIAEMRAAGSLFDEELDKVCSVTR